MSPLRALLASAVACAALASAVPAFADPSPEAAPPPPTWLAQPAKNDNQGPTPPAGSSRLRTWGALFLVVALGGVALWVRRNKGLARVKENTALRVIDTARIGPKAHLVVARCGDRTFLLGVTDGSIRRLSTLPERTVAAHGWLDEPAENAQAAKPGVTTAEPAPRAEPAPGSDVRSFAQLMRRLVHPDTVIREQAEELIAKKDSVPPPRRRDDVADAYMAARARGPERDTFEASAPRISMAVPKGRNSKAASASASTERGAPSQAAGLMSLRAKRG
jgi:flagellar biogenesis protein FliO